MSWQLTLSQYFGLKFLDKLVVNSLFLSLYMFLDELVVNSFTYKNKKPEIYTERVRERERGNLIIEASNMLRIVKSCLKQ